MAAAKADLSLLARVVKRLGPKRAYEMMDAEQRAALPYAWPILARPKQLAPKGPWRYWLMKSGRGFGKTRSGVEWVRGKAKRMPGSRGAIIGQTPDEARRIMIEGPDGILERTPINDRPLWEPSKDLLTWPGPDGATATIYSGAKPAAFRGPNHHWLWCDELAKYARAKEAFDNFNMGLRLEYLNGAAEDREPQGMLTTTPRPIAILRELIKKANTVVTSGSTYENAANLAGSYLDEMRGAYEGTRLGRQELFGDLLDDTPGALWQRAMFDRPGFRAHLELSVFDRICVAIDPAASDTETSDETGIIVAGMWWGERNRRRYHTLADRSFHGSAQQRARRAILALLDHEADCFVVETNNGGDWIPAVIQNEWAQMQTEEAFTGRLPGAAPVHVVTATRGKAVRAEPISTLYEQDGTFSHEPGLEVLEDQLVTWSPQLNEKSPDRLDALVWAGTWLSQQKRMILT